MRDPSAAFTRSQPEVGAHLADALLDLLALHDASSIAAVIVEPMAGSCGVVPPPKGYLQRLREICTANEILLIFDEVITGFGRMGWPPAPGVRRHPDLLNFANRSPTACSRWAAWSRSTDLRHLRMAAGGRP
ncbi:MAG: aminotransferase class III-fold pyridoxal phosphate-dependent enzyme [Kofleriaceae bacterium]